MGLQDLVPVFDTPDGRAYFPYGRLAPGYLLTTPSDEAAVRRLQGRLRWAIVPLAAVLESLPWRHGHAALGLLVFTALYTGLWHAAVYLRCRGLPRARRPMPRVDATRRAATALSGGFIVFGLLACLIFAIGGAVMRRAGIGDRLTDAFSALLFAGFWLWYCRIALVKWRRRAST